MTRLREELRLAHGHQQAGRLGEAEQTYRAVLERHPRCAPALHGMGLVRHLGGASEEAVELLESAVGAQPDCVQYRSNLAAVLGCLGRHAEAARELAVVVEKRPDYAEGWCNLGVALEKQGKFEEAIEAYRKAIQINPAYADAHAFMGNALRGSTTDCTDVADKVRRLVEAEKAHRLCVHIHTEMGDVERAVERLRELVALAPGSPSIHSALLYTLHYDPRLITVPARRDCATKLFEEHLEWGRRHGSRHAPRAVADGTRSVPATRLRIGYISPDFRAHTVPRFISAAIKNHDREQFEVYCYSNSPYEDATTQRLKGWADHWRQIERLNDEKAEQLIREDKIDILVDLRGHGVGNRLTLFARKPAPVQVTMVGYFDTTGLPQMDWRITDGVQDPPGVSEQYHTEKLARLPQTCWCYTADEDSPDVAEAPVLKAGHVTFGCLNKIIKISPGCARIWAEILRSVPNSRLLLAAPGQAAACAVRSCLEQCGIEAVRVTVLDIATNRAEYMARFNQIDICLDPFPFNGITTSCDGLWMGVPLVTLSGRISVSRVGHSLLTAIGLSDLVAVDERHLLQLARELAMDHEGLRQLRASIRERTRYSALMSESNFASSLYSAFTQMWTEACEKQ